MAIAIVAENQSLVKPVDFQECFSYWRGRAYRLYHKHSDLVSQYSRLFLNSIILAGKLPTGIPLALPRAAFAWMSYTGITYTNIMVRGVCKTANDFKYAFKASDWKAAAYTLVRTAVKVTDIVMMFIMFGASLVTLAGFPATSLAIYASMRPISMASLALVISDEIIDFLDTKDILDTCGEDEPPQRMEHFEAYALDQPLDAAALGDERARSMVRVLEEHALGVFQDHPQKIKHCYHEVRKAVDQKHRTTIENIYARIFGYFSLAVCRYYPDSLIQATLTWGISLYYTEKMVREKLRNVKRERRLEQMG